MIRHAGIVVENLNRSIKFYKKLGFTFVEKQKITDPLETIFGQDIIVDGFKSLTWAKLQSSSTSKCSPMIELYCFGELYITNMCNTYNHISITVSDIVKYYKRFKKSKYNGLVAEIKETEDVKLLMVRDPDGNLLELVEEK